MTYGEKIEIKKGSGTVCKGNIWKFESWVLKLPVIPVTCGTETTSIKMSLHLRGKYEIRKIDGVTVTGIADGSRTLHRASSNTACIMIM